MAKIKIFGQLAQLCICRDRWYKKPYYLRTKLVPWLRELLGWFGLSAAQRRACAALAEVSHRTAGINRWQRREIISSVLKGMDYGGRVKKKPPAPMIPEEEVKTKISSLAGEVKRISTVSPAEALEIVTAIKRGGL